MDKKEIVKRLLKPLSCLNKVIPKKKSRILIYANLGFRDNARSLYDYLINNQLNRNFQIICSLNDYKYYVNEEVPENVKFIGAWKGFLYFFISGYVFYTFGKFPVKPAKGQTVVHMWHGMPLKRIGNMQRGRENIDYNYFTYIVATSDFFAGIMMKSFRCTRQQILPTVQPKCDTLTGAKKAVPERLILWLPTYRESNVLKSFDTKGTGDGYKFSGVLKDESEWAGLNRFLGEHCYRIMIKLHPMENVLTNYRHYENIEILSEEDCRRNGIKIYEVYQRSCALISDYSSSYLDYLLLDRPVAFVLDDYDDYKENRGFVVENLPDYMPGPCLTCLEDIYRFIESLADGKDPYKSERLRVNQLLNEYQIGNDTGDLLKKIGILKS